jgi:hypothetical protein
MLEMLMLPPCRLSFMPPRRFDAVFRPPPSDQPPDDIRRRAPPFYAICPDAYAAAMRAPRIHVCAPADTPRTPHAHDAPPQRQRYDSVAAIADAAAPPTCRQDDFATLRVC